MRFETSRVLDAIEQRLCTDPALARGVLHLPEVVRYADLDGGRPASLLRLGLIVDSLGRYLTEENVPVYAVVDRGLLSDIDLTSNERMVVRRWADDGLVEVLPTVGDRVVEVADLTGLPVISRSGFEQLHDRYPWLAGGARLLAPLPGSGGAVLKPRGRGGSDGGASGRPSAAVLGRLWRCSDRDCPVFGDGEDRFGGWTIRPGGQPPPRLRGGVPVCPRHDVRLTDAGPRPLSVVLAVRVGTRTMKRFVVTADRPVVIGRSPSEPDGLMLGHWLNDAARRWISRSHARLELRGQEVIITDQSTNGTVIRPDGSMDDGERITLGNNQSRVLAARDMVEFFPGVQVGHPLHWSDAGGAQPLSVMADAPTMTMRAVQR